MILLKLFSSIFVMFYGLEPCGCYPLFNEGMQEVIPVLAESPKHLNREQKIGKSKKEVIAKYVLRPEIMILIFMEEGQGKK